MAIDKQRQSNIELLRIIAILFVLMGHVGMVMGLPSGIEISESPVSTLTRLFFQSIAVGGVNIFVLISGWFGIRANSKGLAKYIYQVFFLLWGIYVVMLCMGETSLSVHGIKISLGLTKEYWFVMAYLGMYILSPVLNAFCENASEKQFRMLLIVFYCFQSYFCWLSGFLNYFEGYSVVFFCGLYLTARYFRLYPMKIVNNNAWVIYIVCCLLVFCMASFGEWKMCNALRMLRYDNPLVIVSAISLLIVFSRWHMQSKFINWLAASCFAVYIIHFNPFVFIYFKKGVLYITNKIDGIEFLIVLGVYILFVFLVCVIIDKIRVFSWIKFFKQ